MKRRNCKDNTPKCGWEMFPHSYEAANIKLCGRPATAVWTICASTPVCTKHAAEVRSMGMGKITKLCRSMTRSYRIKNSKGEYLAHQGERWTRDVKAAHVFDSYKTPRGLWQEHKCLGEVVTTEDWWAQQ